MGIQHQKSHSYLCIHPSLQIWCSVLNIPPTIWSWVLVLNNGKQYPGEGLISPRPDVLLWICSPTILSLLPTATGRFQALKMQGGSSPHTPLDASTTISAVQHQKCPYISALPKSDYCRTSSGSLNWRNSLVPWEKDYSLGFVALVRKMPTSMERYLSLWYRMGASHKY